MLLEALLRLRGSLPRPAASGCGYELVGRPGQLCPAPGTLYLFCFLVSAASTILMYPLVSRPVCVKGGALVPARPPIKVMMWEGDHLLGAQTLMHRR